MLPATSANGIIHKGTIAVDKDPSRGLYLFPDQPRTLRQFKRFLAGKLQRIDHLSLSPETMGPLLQSLVQAGTRYLENPEPGTEAEA